VLDIGGNTTRVDNGKEYYAYTTEKKPANWFLACVCSKQPEWTTAKSEFEADVQFYVSFAGAVSS
jgi:hypothetical protein